MTLPHMLGVQDELEKDVVRVTVYGLPESKTQVIVGTPKGEAVVNALPDKGMAAPDGGHEFMLAEVLNGNHWPRYENKGVFIENAKVQRVLSPTVFTVGTSPQNQIFVIMPVKARPNNNDDGLLQVEVKARVNIDGKLLKTPPAERAAPLFNIEKLSLEPAPLPPLYVEAETVKVTQIKPLWGHGE